MIICSELLFILCVFIPCTKAAAYEEKKLWGKVSEKITTNKQKRKRRRKKIIQTFNVHTHPHTHDQQYKRTQSVLLILVECENMQSSIKIQKTFPTV